MTWGQQAGAPVGPLALRIYAAFNCVEGSGGGRRGCYRSCPWVSSLIWGEVELLGVGCRGNRVGKRSVQSSASSTAPVATAGAGAQQAALAGPIPDTTLPPAGSCSWRFSTQQGPLLGLDEVPLHFLGIIGNLLPRGGIVAGTQLHTSTQTSFLELELGPWCSSPRVDSSRAFRALTRLLQ